MGNVQTMTTRAVHDADPRELLLKQASADLAEFEPQGHDVTLLVYVRPEKIWGPEGKVEFIIPETSSIRAEDRFQGIVGLIAKLGPNVERQCDALHLRLPKLYEWWTASISDCRSFTMGKLTCRQVEVQMLWAKVARPDLVS